MIHPTIPDRNSSKIQYLLVAVIASGGEIELRQDEMVLRGVQAVKTKQNKTNKQTDVRKG